MFAHPPSPFAVALQRALACVCVALVLVLGAAGVNTELHARIHGGDAHGHAYSEAHSHSHAHGHSHASSAHSGATAAHQDEGCVIDLFAQGVATAVDQPAIATVQLLGESRYQTVAEQAAPTKPAGWLPPVCGPPLK